MCEFLWFKAQDTSIFLAASLAIRQRCLDLLVGICNSLPVRILPAHLNLTTSFIKVNKGVNIK